MSKVFDNDKATELLMNFCDSFILSVKYAKKASSKSGNFWLIPDHAFRRVAEDYQKLLDEMGK